MATWDVYEVALELIRSLCPVVATLKRHDPDLARQLVRAATSVPLNLAEANRRAGRDRLHLFRTAAGSASESRSCLDTAAAWGYLEAAAAATPRALTDRLGAMLYRMTR